jgi:hypothetical protein
MRVRIAGSKSRQSSHLLKTIEMAGAEGQQPNALVPSESS